MTQKEPSPFVRHDWTTDEIVAIHDLPLLDLIAKANRVHRHFHDVGDVQKASLLSIKTGGCPENCAYCPQSAHHRDVRLGKVDMMDTQAVLAAAARAKAAGADRFCMGAAWRNVRDGAAFDAVLDMVRGACARPNAALVAGLASRRGATNRRRSSMTGHSFHSLPEQAKGVTHVSGTKCRLCLGTLNPWID